jgi:DNA-binding ferritin-like protein
MKISPQMRDAAESIILRAKKQNLTDRVEYLAEYLEKLAVKRDQRVKRKLRKVVTKLREDAYQYRSPFYTLTPHVDEEERKNRAKMLEEVAVAVEKAMR